MKTHQEKAKELVNKIWLKIPTSYTPMHIQAEQRENGTDDMSIAKKIALICVDEKIKSLQPWKKYITGRGQIEDLKEVKKGINKL